jgi:predicted nucleotidyltransferase
LPSVVIKSADREHIGRAVAEYVATLRALHPEIERVIWFGSWVNGLPTPGSDVDLCLILESSGQPLRERMAEFLPVGFPVGIDLFPYTRDEFDRLADHSPGWRQAILCGQDI